MQISEEDYIAHYGILRRSGRYPWGSGGTQNVRNKTFLNVIDEMRAEGMSDTEIARGFGIKLTELRAAKVVAKNQQKQSQISQAERWKAKGMSDRAIAERMFGDPKKDTKVRALLAPGAKEKADSLRRVSEMLKKEVDTRGFIDVSSGAEHHVNVSRTKLDNAIAQLKEEGYELHQVKGRQLGTDHDTKTKVLGPPGSTQRDAFLNKNNIKHITARFDNDTGELFEPEQPLPIDVKRIGINWKEDGGDKEDGVIYVRPGVEDISLGKNNYAQVRIQVGKDHYLKGMAMYRTDLPEGVDLLFNTVKSEFKDGKRLTKLDAMKPLVIDKGTGEVDKDLPFGAIVTQIQDPETKKPTSVMNLVTEEGDWDKWSRTLSSQMLSKQKMDLINAQLAMTLENRQLRYKAISALTNPVVRKKMLEDFAASTDLAAIHLKAAHLPRQAVKVILPLKGIKPTEIYVPGFNNGERVVLIRHPHAGTFEIPELRVNNRNPEGKLLLDQAVDAVGIHHTVAEHLSGADFDGDTVLVIPNDSNRVLVTPALEDLKDFDPRSAYPPAEGVKVMSNTQTEMGKISNLITDMSLQGAPAEDLVRAVKHSMVVIDAEKHELNYRLSAQDQGIQQLKDKYQSGGASTIISRAKSQERVLDRKLRPQRDGGPIDPDTGELVYVPTGAVNYKTGKPLTNKSKKLAETNDARTLLSGPTHEGTPQERAYANHSNKLKAMANKARLDTLSIERPKQSSSARTAHAAEVASLSAKLTLAEYNRPLERHAQRIANAAYQLKVRANPHMDDKEKKKVKFKALEEARLRMDTKSNKIQITQEEWNAIQANAISATKLESILMKADMDMVNELATPRRAHEMTKAMTNRALAMKELGYTRAEIAGQLGVPVGTLDEAIYT